MGFVIRWIGMTGVIDGCREKRVPNRLKGSVYASKQTMGYQSVDNVAGKDASEWEPAWIARRYLLLRFGC